MFESTMDAAELTLAEYAAVLDRAEPLDGPTALAWLTTAAPSAHSLQLLALIDLGELDAHDRITALGLWERCRSWLDAQLQHALVAVGGSAAAPEDARDDWAREDVALALRLSTVTAAGHLADARQLLGRLARTGRALESGELTLRHARALVDALDGHPDEIAVAVEAAMLDGGPAFETLANFRRRLARAVIAADPRTADEQHTAAVAGRKVAWWAEPHGMATLQATMTADEVMTAMRALTAIADHARSAGDDRPVDVRRADALTGLLSAALADPALPTGPRDRPLVGMTIDSATLLRLADNPAHLDGYGPIPPAMARRIAAGGDWHRLVTDPVGGALLDYGSTVYRPPADLARYITARDRTCRFPTCSRAARHSDIDHAVPFDEGGPTSARNCGAASRRHHRQKTARNTHLESHPDGSATWTTSTGHTYHQAAIDHCPEHTAYLSQLRAERGATDAEIAEAAQRRVDPAELQDDTAEQQQIANESASKAHDDVAAKADRDESHGDTRSGNDPPPF